MGERLAIALRLRGKEPPWLISAMRSSKGTVYNILDDTTKPEKLRVVTAEAICHHLRIRQSWLIHGIKPIDADGADTVSRDETNPGYVRFPLLEGFVGAGEGGYVPDKSDVVSFIEVAEDWAKQKLSAPIDRIRVITVRGDSMQPDIESGDVLFVDSAITYYDSDGVYVLNWQDRPLVKRLQLRRDGTLLIKSSNPAYEPEVVSLGESDQLHISGRVLASWNFKRF